MAKKSKKKRALTAQNKKFARIAKTCRSEIESSGSLSTWGKCLRREWKK